MYKYLSCTNNELNYVTVCREINVSVVRKELGKRGTLDVKIGRISRLVVVLSTWFCCWGEVLYHQWNLMKYISSGLRNVVLYLFNVCSVFNTQTFFLRWKTKWYFHSIWIEMWVTVSKRLELLQCDCNTITLLTGEMNKNQMSF